MKNVGQEASTEAIEKVMWPSKEACPKCYLDEKLRKGKWNLEQVYIHLKNEYW